MHIDLLEFQVNISTKETRKHSRLQYSGCE